MKMSGVITSVNTPVNTLGSAVFYQFLSPMKNKFVILDNSFPFLSRFSLPLTNTHILSFFFNTIFST